MKKIILIVFMHVAAITAMAQQQSQSSFNYLNKYNLNPAFTGLDTCTKIFAQQKNQWLGVNGAPVNTLLQGHTQIKNQLGVGGGINRWKAGLLSSINLQASVAKHILFKEKYTLSVGLNAGYARYAYGANEIIAFDHDDYLDLEQAADGAFYADLGFLFSTEKWEAGIAIPRLLTTSPSFDVNGMNQLMQVERYLNMHAAYKYQLNNSIELVPSLMYRTIPSNGGILDAMVTANVKQNLGVTLGYRTNNGLLASAHYTFLDKFTVGYAYDAGLQALNGISSGSHEFLLGFNLCRAPKQDLPKKVLQYFISGTVQDSDGTPLENALVSVIDSNGVKQSVATDSSGNYRLALMPNIPYKTEISHPAHKTTDGNVSMISSLTEMTKNWSLTPLSYAISGIVKDDESGKPINGVLVKLSNGQQASTDQNGKLTFDIDSFESELQATLSKTGYESATQTINLVQNNFDPVAFNTTLSKVEIVKPKEEEAKPKMIEVDPIYFAVGSAELNSEAKNSLDQVVTYMNEHPEIKLEIGSHTDCTGNAASNQRLSEARAIASLKYIQSRIESPSRATGKGYGSTKPLTSCECKECSKEQHAKNRRTEFKIIE